MKSRQTSHFLLFLLTFLFFGNVNAQCPVTAFASKSTVVCGEPVALTAVAEGCKPLNNNFNNGNIGNDWKATTGAVVNNGTGTYSCVGPPPEGANQLWMGATVAAPREVATNVYDLTQCAAVGGSICFWMKYGRQGAPSPCEGIDLPAEGVSLQYKTATGAWTTIRYWDPNGGNDANLTSWKRYCINIPAAAMTTATEFRWRQEESSGAGFDTWGLDDVVITLSAPGYTYDWAHDAPQGPLATPTTPDVQPTTNTTYTVTYTNGIETCNSSVTVNVLLPSVTASASKILVCEGTQVQLDAVSSLIAVAPTACGITTYSGCPPNSVAGEPQIGNGNIVNSNNSITNNTFGDFSDNNMRTQILYRAAELTAQGFSAGQIANIQFDIASILTGGAYSSFRIQIGCTSQNAFTNNASSFVGGLTQVYGPTTISLTPGWNTFFFDKSFNWDGTSNIVVQICWTTNSSNDREAYTRDHTTNFISCVQGVENNNTGANVCTSSTFFSEESQRPNTRFGTCVPNTTPIEYSWTPAANLNNSDIQNPIATVNATTTYTVTALQQGYPAGCAATNTVTVSAYKPVITVNPNPANICPPGTNSVVLNGSGTTNTTIPATRTFTNGSAVAIPDAGGAITATCGTPGATQSSVIAVTAINPATLAANMVLEVAVNMTSANNGDYRIELVAPNGSVIALKLQQTANGANMTNTRFRAMGPAMANGGAPYNNVYGSADPFTNLTGNINGNWTLRITDYCKPLGTGTSTGTLTNWSITFNTQNYVATWLWTPATNLSSTTTPTTTASPTTSSPYTLTGTDFNGCSASVTVPVNVNTAPSIPVNSETICAGSSATLTATPFDGGGGTYSWSPGGATTQSITVSPASTTGYTVTYSSGGCTGTGNGTVTVNPTPTVTITNPTPTVCAGTAATLTANVSQAGGTYSWMPGGATTASITVTPAT
ncbi:MAG: proprotein convertase P-domain-containing protein, partial [Bacteroidetes bacterium]|nr:proprotein convertase P-domain-containing protein [Bacteroidota bacterium]